MASEWVFRKGDTVEFSDWLYGRVRGTVKWDVHVTSIHMNVDVILPDGQKKILLTSVAKAVRV